MGTSTWSGKMPTLPITQGSSAKDDGSARGSLPNSTITTLSSTIPSATVAISQEFVPRATNGRTAIRSTTRPQTAQANNATGIAATIGQCIPTTRAWHSTAPSMTDEPWAKLTVPETANVKVKPS